MVTTAAYIWMAYCAVSHVRIEAKKRNKILSLKERNIAYIIQILIYWAITAMII